MAEKRQIILDFDVLIQDVFRDRVYHIPGDRIGAFAMSLDAANTVPAGTVTFVIAGDKAVEQVPIVGNPVEQPSVLVRYPEANTAFFLEHSQLRTFEREMLAHARQYGHKNLITFVMPFSTSLIQEFPAAMRASLQGGNKLVLERPTFGWRY
jgi:hypothetical protein